MKNVLDLSTDEDFSSDSDEEHHPLQSKHGSYPKFGHRENPSDNKVIHVCSFVLGAALMAPFMVIVCSAEDMLSGSKQPTGLVIIALTAPSFFVKFCFLVWKGLRNVSVVGKILVTYMLVTVGMLCVAFSQTDYNLRYVGVCLVALGMSVGEISLLIIATTKQREKALSSLITGSAVGGILSTLPYVGMTNWSDVNPRISLLLPVIWPALHLLMFAVMQLKNIGKPSYQKIPESSADELRVLGKSKRFRVRRFFAVWKALDHLLLLYVSYFSVFLSIGAILSTLVFTRSTAVGPREDYHHYILSIVIGQFFGRSFMSLLVAKFPDVSSTPFQALGTFFSIFIMFLFIFASWNHFIHHLWLVFALCFLQGTFLGILTIISYHCVANYTREPHLEFLLILTNLLETFGMLCAGLIGLYTEPLLCRHCYEVSFGNSSYCLARSSDSEFWVNGKGGLM